MISQLQIQQSDDDDDVAEDVYLTVFCSDLQVKGGVVACRRWLRGRSLYFSRLLTSRARSRYFFLAYLLTIHVLVLMCLTGAL